MSRLITKQLLLNNNFWVLNKDMVQLLGLEGAFLLSNFAEAETLMADKEGWFYQTSDTVEKITTLSRHKQDQAIKKLKDLGIIEQTNRGVPPKRYFKINYECLTNQFVKNQQIEVLEIDKLNCKKSATNKERIYKEHNYKESIEEPSVTSPKFDEETIEYQLSEMLYKNILDNDDKTKKPNLYKWAEHIDKLMRIDKRSVEDIKKVIDFATNDDFWMSNILSTNKLRKQFPKLILKVREDNGGRNNKDFNKTKRANESIGADIAKRAGVKSF